MFDARDARFLVGGVALAGGALALSVFWSPDLVAAIGGTIGVGALVMSPIVVRSARGRTTVLTVVFLVFLARVATIAIDDPWSVHAALRDVFAVLIVGVALTLAHEHVQGLEQLAQLFGRRDGGYAVVLDEGAASRTIESELARSRRHDVPLTFLVLRTPNGGHPPVFERTAARVSSRALAELELRYFRGRTCELIAERVRRSDVVVCSADGNFLVIASDTTAKGTEAVADRIIGAVNSELNVELHAGVAAFPSDGGTYSELLASAFSGTDHADGDQEEPAPAAGAGLGLEQSTPQPELPVAVPELPAAVPEVPPVPPMRADS
jgi:hypothetical protein